MIANTQYIDSRDFNFNHLMVNENIVDTLDSEDYFSDNIFFNAYQKVYIISTEELVNKEQSINNQVRDITRILSFIDNSPSIFANSTKHFVVKSFEEMRDGLMQLSLDFLSTDISKEDECLFMYGQKNNIKLFFNLFFDKNKVETLVNISTPGGKYVIEDNIKNSLKQLSEIFQKNLE